MNSLPEIPIFSHSKKILLPMQKLEISIQTVPNHQIDCDLPYLKKKILLSSIKRVEGKILTCWNG